jgi:predicted GNAT superfamily acetyltransferase
MTHYTLRPFETFADHEQCVALQRAVWVGDDPVPTNVTLTFVHHDGVAIGAFDADNRMIGFVMSFVAPSHFHGATRGLCHHSHMAGVLPGWQGQGIGEALKRAQAEVVRQRGYNLITWTYDPLEAKNARLNIGKLGCICRTFIPNCYGEMRDALNAGLPSDRFEVEWWLDRKVENGEWRMGNGQIRISNRQSPLAIEIPRDFQRIKRADLTEALGVRLALREQFQRAFADGYAAVDFELTDDRATYVLARL